MNEEGSFGAVELPSPGPPMDAGADGGAPISTPSSAPRPRLRRASSQQQSLMDTGAGSSGAMDSGALASSSPRSIARALPATGVSATIAPALSSQVEAPTPARSAMNSLDQLSLRVAAPTPLRGTMESLPSAPELARKVQSQAAELLGITRVASEASTYVQMLERRLLELAPEHPMPVRDVHLGTPVAAVSALVAAAPGRSGTTTPVRGAGSKR